MYIIYIIYTIHTYITLHYMTLHDITLHYIHKNKYAQPPLRSNAVQRLAPHVTSCDIMRPT